MKANAFALASVAALMLLAVPAMSDEADADTASLRIGDYYVYDAVFNIVFEENYFQTDYIYMLEGSENHQAMQRYLEDPMNNDVREDDRDIINENIGGKVHVYYLESGTYYSSVHFNDGFKQGTLVLEPYNEQELFVKGGDTLNITLHNATTNYGEEAYVTVGNGYNSTRLVAGSTTVLEPAYGTTYTVGIYDTCLYCDISYDVDGVSYPGGSATAFVIVCFAIAAISIAILVFAARKPKWSE